MTERPKLTVTKLRKEEGVWRCRVSINGETVEAMRFGGWKLLFREAKYARKHVMREALPWVAEELQSRLPAVERKPRGKPRAKAGSGYERDAD